MSNAIATNAAANSAVSYLSRNSDMQSSSIAKLSSGSRIVKASDDAASLAVGTKLKADVTALKQASTNADQAASLMQVADGALSRIGDTLMRMKSLATQARSDVLSDTERGYLDQEYQEMISQIDFIASSTKFNGVAVVNGELAASTGSAGDLNSGAKVAASTNAEARVNVTGSIEGTYTVAYDTSNGNLSVTDASGNSQMVDLDHTQTEWDGEAHFDSYGLTFEFTKVDLDKAIVGGAVTVTGNDARFQLGVTAGGGATGDDVSVGVDAATASELSVNDTDIGSIGSASAGAEQASSLIDSAIETINTRRANLGASMSRMEKISDNLATTTENLDAARSTLMDVDVAAEMTEFSKNQVMTQASTAMLAQANQLPQNLMRLLQ